jgi:hypothetical protein
MLLLQCATTTRAVQVCSWSKHSSMMQARDWQFMLRLIAVSCYCSSSARAAAHGCLRKHPYDTAAQQQDARCYAHLELLREKLVTHGTSATAANSRVVSHEVGCTTLAGPRAGELAVAIRPGRKAV